MSDDLYDGPCEAGCISFHGGERKHHKDCGHYPHSLTKVNADRIEELEAKLITAEQRGYANAMEAERKLHEEHIEERDDIIRHDRKRIEELVSMVNSKDARIEELQAKLAKALDGLHEAESAPEPDHYVPQFRYVMDIIGATLAELKGETDD